MATPLSRMLQTTEEDKEKVVLSSFSPEYYFSSLPTFAAENFWPFAPSILPEKCYLKGQGFLAHLRVGSVFSSPSLPAFAKWRFVPLSATSTVGGDKWGYFLGEGCCGQLFGMLCSYGSLLSCPSETFFSLP